MRFTENPPRTIMELFKMLPEGTLAEIIHPDTKETTGFILREGQYKDTIKLSGRIKSPLLDQEFIF